MTRPSPPERPPADPKTEETLKSKAPPHWFIPAAEGLFCPLTGINCNLTSSPTTRPTRCFRPLAGRTLSVTAYAVPAPPMGELLQLPLPCTKLSLRESWRAAPERVLRGEVVTACTASIIKRASGNRPLAGMSCNPRKPTSSTMTTSFRPLAGISCNSSQTIFFCGIVVFPSPCGDKL